MNDHQDPDARLSVVVEPTRIATFVGEPAADPLKTFATKVVSGCDEQSRCPVGLPDYAIVLLGTSARLYETIATLANLVDDGEDRGGTAKVRPLISDQPDSDLIGPTPVG